MTGTHRGEFQGLPATGNDVEIYALSKLRVEDGQVVEVHDYYDTKELQAQLGMTFPAVIGQVPRLVWGKVRDLL